MTALRTAFSSLFEHRLRAHAQESAGLGSNPSLPVTSCVTLDELLNLPESHIPQLYYGNNSNDFRLG